MDSARDLAVAEMCFFLNIRLNIDDEAFISANR